MLKIAWTENYVLSLPPNHRFPMSKYEVLPQQLLHEGTIREENLFRPLPIEEKWISRTHKEEYWYKLRTLSLTPKEIRRTGFPLTEELVNREVTIMNGTLLCTHSAFEFGISMNIAGGTHHAFTNRGEGFCLLNDIAIAANYLLEQKQAERILVIDLDVHQGNGTAEIFKDEPRVFTFSMHGANNYPLIKEKSDLDIALADFTDDAFYLKTLDANLKNIFDTFQPDFIFFQSGVDILSTDKLGRLSVSREGCKQRDRLVLTLAYKNKIPLVASMGGGYSPDFRDIIEAHANTYRLAQEIYF
ncbi:histone deacetylase family protein [Chryseosolibacter indicus]|uniref:Histone deacetylase n=1 Tax=Chryseosolibacter indicus TaxID=2782351 RepID=A0ABS5VKA1_9BACT|nr:histone deacetylase [Chryseosolibacter indicus]MBT1701874.1 histone deacetylase [Chryseosolibacter indicus]